MDKTKIEWADSTWNPISGCYHKCPYCYARAMVNRFSNVKIEDGNNQIITLDEPYIAANGKRLPYPWGFIPTFHRYRLNDFATKSGRTIFVCSMADLFGEWVPDSWIEDVFDACENAPQHRYLFLTKNPSRYVRLARAGLLSSRDNMWYGITMTRPSEPFYFDQDRNTFISVEPISSDFSNGVIVGQENIDPMQHVDWIIIGAETGRRKGKIVPKKKWIDSVTAICDKYDIPVFMKDSLIPIIGEDNMRREFPWKENKNDN